MKKISVLLALLAWAFTDLALANAVVTSLTGTAQAQRGTTPPRALRLGDELVQGDTVSTGGNSSVVMRFDDGQIAALTSNSRMTITAYQYDAQARTGNVLLSLVVGGMRAVTGLIGRNTPQRVSYRAATATIGIRGTDCTMVTIRGDVVVTVTEGEISFTFGGKTIIVKAGEGVNARADGTFQHDAAEQILGQVPADVAEAFGGLAGLTNAINSAAQGGTSTIITPAPAGGDGVSPS